MALLLRVVHNKDPDTMGQCGLRTIETSNGNWLSEFSITAFTDLRKEQSGGSTRLSFSCVGVSSF